MQPKIAMISRLRPRRMYEGERTESVNTRAYNPIANPMDHRYFH
jgi:hypothetical protein